MAYIEWTDDEGTGVLTPSYPATGVATKQARRFRNWTPVPMPVGPVRFALGTGRRFQFEHRRDYLASFEMPGLKPDLHFALVHRFILHALKGCEFYVYTEDANAATYECRLAEGAEPEFTMSDPQLLEYTLALRVKNLAAAPLLCDYTSTGA